ncbi:IFN-alpha/beta binding protein [White-tailed deer poxvirus]|nr:IFN-alpha/beta binding protein [White-tailed deer poxvirus]
MILKLLYIFIASTISINLENDLIELYNGYKGLLSENLKTVINESCLFVGEDTKFATNKELLRLTCPITKDRLLGFVIQNKNNYDVMWETISYNVTSPYIYNSNIDDQNLILIPYNESIHGDTFLCTVSYMELCFQSIIHIRKYSATDRCKKSDMSELSISIDVYCGILHYPYTTIDWYKDGKKLHIDNKKYSNNNKLFLTITNITHEDGGIYKCNGYQDLDNITYSISRCTEVSIKKVHDFILYELPTNTNVIKGENITIDCYAVSNPEDYIVLMWEDVSFGISAYQISYDSEYRDENTILWNTKLFLNDIKNEDNGTIYTCSGSNDYITKITTTTLIII